MDTMWVYQKLHLIEMNCMLDCSIIKRDNTAHEANMKAFDRNGNTHMLVSHGMFMIITRAIQAFNNKATTPPSSKYHTTLFKVPNHPLQSTTPPSSKYQTTLFKVPHRHWPKPKHRYVVLGLGPVSGALNIVVFGLGPISGALNIVVLGLGPVSGALNIAVLGLGPVIWRSCGQIHME